MAVSRDLTFQKRQSTNLFAVAGTADGHGFAEDINAQSDFSGNEVAEAYYRASRLYNSGAIDPSNDLEKGSATHCYVSDIANRLMGWTDAAHGCTLDDSTES